MKGTALEVLPTPEKVMFDVRPRGTEICELDTLHVGTLSCTVTALLPLV
ncbi:hypothetical protein PFLCHA0_c36280 [Pseudomonas protegens CHA0]|uniref:Uncharacterized protein n=1 Tax=Pseudomonas protegens (strain DSM 19095 / LMG 27888 / CFBP 6595 / CHA0) TaxID=1124983 RepID=A0A2C9EP16_PSEPH|nr:hypothetical protein PFLCHA0_c36280 [Pseudomonas protegens CHA0]